MKKKTTFTPFLLILLLVPAAVSRALAYGCTVVSTDIAYPAWVEGVLSYAVDIFEAVRITLIFVAVSFAVFTGKNRASTVAVSLVSSFADYAARFFIDYFTGAIAESEALALVWVGLNFLLEAVFVGLSYILAQIMVVKNADPDGRLKKINSYTYRQMDKVTWARSALYSTGIYLGVRILGEVYYLIDFLTSYVNITSGEIASIVGAFLRIVIIWGGVPVIVNLLCRGILPDNAGKRK